MYSGRVSPPDADDSNRVALVTGGCSGIGRAIAERLAARGHSLVLVSERRDALGATASEIRGKHHVAVRPVTMDLARPEAAAELHAIITGLGLVVDILVNNAGCFFFGETVDADPARAAAMLHLHVVTPSLLCTLFGHDMRAVGRGHIQPSHRKPVYPGALSVR